MIFFVRALTYRKSKNYCLRGLKVVLIYFKPLCLFSNKHAFEFLNQIEKSNRAA